ncbi:MAG: pyridoxine 5-phosphate synthase [Candidatus Tokpelaia sp. JSC188]|nr:MAG: pyridoxine 5-phosphate synthase [Candidatus Tokpelaia sp. JSC188]
MFALVADIEHYPEFLPMCKDLIIRSSQKQDSKTFLIADMTVGYKLVRETFTTQVYLRPEENRIDVQYVDGPFRYLENRWLFLPMENKNVCRLEFFIEYEFKNSIFSLMMGSMFDAIFCKFTNAFEKRANEIYGIEN